MKFDPQKHQRRSIRLAEYDYSQTGAYFVTIVTRQRECMFGVISDNQMQLSRLGEIIQQEWHRSAQIRREIELDHDEFVFMPNHMHGIVQIVDPVGADGIRPDNLRHNDVRSVNADAGQDNECCGGTNQMGERQEVEREGGASLAPLRGTGGMEQPEGGFAVRPYEGKGGRWGRSWRGLRRR